MQATTIELAVCYGCKGMMDREEMDQCASCEEFMCMKPECSCACECSESDEGAQLWRLLLHIHWLDARRWLLSRLDVPLAAVLGVVVRVLRTQIVR